MATADNGSAKPATQGLPGRPTSRRARRNADRGSLPRCRRSRRRRRTCCRRQTGLPRQSLEQAGGPPPHRRRHQRRATSPTFSAPGRQFRPSQREGGGTSRASSSRPAPGTPRGGRPNARRPRSGNSRSSTSRGQNHTSQSSQRPARFATCARSRWTTRGCSGLIAAMFRTASTRPASPGSAPSAADSPTCGIRAAIPAG